MLVVSFWGSTHSMFRWWVATRSAEWVANMCNLYSITTNQEAIIRLFRVVNRYVGNLGPMTGSFLTTWLP